MASNRVIANQHFTSHEFCVISCYLTHSYIQFKRIYSINNSRCKQICVGHSCCWYAIQILLILNRLFVILTGARVFNTFYSLKLLILFCIFWFVYSYFFSWMTWMKRNSFHWVIWILIFILIEMLLTYHWWMFWFGCLSNPDIYRIIKC